MEDPQRPAGSRRARSISVFDIDILGGEPLEDLGERARPIFHLHGEHFIVREFDAQAGKSLARRLKLIDDHSQHAALARIHHRQGADVDLVVGQRRADLGESAGLVLETGRHLVDEFHSFASQVWRHNQKTRESVRNRARRRRPGGPPEPRVSFHRSSLRQPLMERSHQNGQVITRSEGT